MTDLLRVATGLLNLTLFVLWIFAICKPHVVLPASWNPTRKKAAGIYFIVWIGTMMALSGVGTSIDDAAEAERMKDPAYAKAKREQAAKLEEEAQISHIKESSPSVFEVKTSRDSTGLPVITVDLRMSEPWDAAGAVTDINSAMTKVCQEIVKTYSGDGTAVLMAEVKAKDVYGNSDYEPASGFGFAFSELRKVNWDGFDSDNLPELAAYIQIRPILRRGLAAWCSDDDNARHRICREFD